MGKRKSKALIIVVLLNTPIFVNAIDSNVTINFDNVIKLYDKMQVTINIGGDTTTSTIGYGTKVEQPFNDVECSSESVESFNRTRKIDYYKDVNFINREYKAIRYYEPEGKAVNYFTRNPKPSSDMLWTGSSWIGGIATINVDTEGGIVPVFRIWDGKSS